MDLTFIGGENFSGRTARLRNWVGLAPAKNSTGRAALIGLDPTEAFSGLAPTVSAELELSAADPAALLGARKAIEQIGFGYVLEQNPFSLSGGEQVVVAIIAATASRPERLAIDGALEQLTPTTRDLLLRYLATLEGAATIADNRLGEWATTNFESPMGAIGAPVIEPRGCPALVREPVAVDVVDLCFAYKRGRPVFDRLNLHFEAGRPYLLKGPNGSGKTTLSRLLCGLLRPASGEIRFDGKPVQPWRLPGHFASYHFQNPNYQLFARTVGMELAQADNKLIVAQRFGLDTNLGGHPLDLPFVLRKRLAIAAAVLRPPRFLILDEPTLGQDDRATEAMSQLLATRGGLRITHAEVFNGLDCIDLERQEAKRARL